MSAQNLIEEETTERKRQKRKGSSLSEHVRHSLANYFADLDGHQANGLYHLMISQVEKPMFEMVMEQTRGNITKAAEILGINRVTLRNRLKKYDLDK